MHFLKKNKNISEYKASVNFNNGKKTHLSISKDDTIRVSSGTLDKEWLKAKNVRTGEKGLVAKSFLIKSDLKIENLEGYFNINRSDATLKLMLPGVAVGTYIIRPCHDMQRKVISVRYQNKEGKPDVANYVINVNEVNMYYIRTDRYFNGIRDLIKYFSEHKELLVLFLQPYTVSFPLPPLEDCEIPREDIEYKRVIGKGEFGEVHEAKWNGKIDVAVKCITKSCKNLKNFHQEAKIIQSLRHSFILQLIGICSPKENEDMCIITEYLKHGSIKSFLIKDQRQELTMDHLLQMIYQIAQGMQYLSSKDIVHRDLRADNILVADDLTIRISDFGLSMFITNEDFQEKSITTMFPVRWSAPEVIKNDVFNEKTDVWSYGVTSFEIMSRGEQPFHDKNNQEVKQAVMDGLVLEFPLHFLCPLTIKKLMSSCWKYNPEERHTFDGIVKEIKNYLDSSNIIKYNIQ